MHELYIEALQNYLNGHEWQENIEVFVTANCRCFSNVKDFTHEHHQLWRVYHDIVEQILEMALSSAGGSVRHLEDYLDSLATSKRPAKGPREDHVKDILQQLLTYSSFQDFSYMMNKAYNNLEYNPHVNSPLIKNKSVVKNSPSFSSG